MARPLIPFVQNGYYASRNWIPLVKGNGFTTSGGGEQEEVWETASGSIVTFDAVPAPLRQLSVSVEPVQNLNGYDNPWPAGGGKNKLKSKPINSSSGTTAGITWTINADGSISLSGTSTDYAHIYFNAVDTKQVLASGSVNLVCSAQASYNPRIMGINFQNDIYVDDTYVGTIQRGSISRACSGTKIEVGTSRLRIAPNTEIPSGTVFYPAIEIGTTISLDWTPYSNVCPITGFDSVTVYHSGADTSNSTVYTIQLGETVYGGTLDVVNGKMTVDRAMVDLGSLENWSKNTTLGGYRFAVYGENVKPNSSASAVPNCLCSEYAAVSPNGTWTGNTGVSINLTNGQILVCDPSKNAMTPEEFKVAMSGVKLVYELATPFELTLTPEQISTLQGTNNVWSDAGDVTVEYRAQ